MFTQGRVLFDFQKQRKYPHMLPADVALWERFIDRNPGYFSRVEYDVHVGGGLDIQEWWTDSERQAYSWLAAKRIDVVGHRNNQIYIIEVKPEAGISAIGQVLCYRMLYREKYKPTAALVGCIVTDYITPDERWISSQLNLVVFSL